jgi:hypothetical protein
MKVQHPQEQQDKGKPLTEFIKEGEAVTPLHHSPIFIFLSFVLLVVLINCMDSSHGRRTNALPAYGTTVIQTGSLVNDISSS